jgi:hypothetical protein
MIVISQSIGDYKTAFHYSSMRYKAADDEYKGTGLLTPFLTASLNTLGQSFAVARLYDEALKHLELSVEFRKKMPGF